MRIVLDVQVYDDNIADIKILMGKRSYLDSLEQTVEDFFNKEESKVDQVKLLGINWSI